MSLPGQIIERAEALINYSDNVYPALDQIVNKQTRARKIIRLGIQTIAHASREYSTDQTGEFAHLLLHQNLVAGGIVQEHTNAWPNYQKLIDKLPTALPKYLPHDSGLDEFSKLYADTTRRTIGRDGEFESDASHAAHLMALAIPYASQYYPDLNPHRIALYSLLHDAPEAYAGDTPTLGATAAVLHQKELRELEARELIAQLFKDPYPELVQLIEDYENRIDDESCFVKTIDKIDPKFTYGYSNGIALTRDYGYTVSQFQAITGRQRAKLRAGYGSGYEDVIQMHCALSGHYINRIPWPNKTSA